MQYNRNVGVEKYVFKGKESNCYVILLFGDPLDNTNPRRLPKYQKILHSMVIQTANFSGVTPTQASQRLVNFGAGCSTCWMPLRSFNQPGM